MSEGKASAEVRVYWQPGCTSCLRTKEFLAKHGIAFVSRNVLADEAAFAELARFGLRQVPIVTRGDRWANGQVLADVARLVGIAGLNGNILAPRELERRLTLVLAAAERYFKQVPDGHLGTLLPNRPRTYSELAYHIFNVADAFVELSEGIALTFDAYNRVPPQDQRARGDILGYGRRVQSRLAGWFGKHRDSADWSARADVYYGAQSLHQFLERTTWHSMQHTRQLAWVLEGMGIEPDQALGKELFDGLPMPAKVWDDEKIAAA